MGFRLTDYLPVGEAGEFHCILLFNLKHKLKAYGCPKVDLLRILQFCSYKLSPEGYMVYGDYFEEG